MKFDLPDNYHAIVTLLKEKIQRARVQAAFKLNADLLAIYHEIGTAIADQEKQAGWGSKVVEKLSKDLRSEFKDMRGLSPRNLRYMRDFAVAYPYFPFLQDGLAKTRDKKDGIVGLMDHIEWQIDRISREERTLPPMDQVKGKKRIVKNRTTKSKKK